MGKHNAVTSHEVLSVVKKLSGGNGEKMAEKEMEKLHSRLNYPPEWIG